MSSDRTAWNIKSSDVAKRAHNPIRAIVDKLKIDPNATKSFISLSVGDPTIFGNFNTDPTINESIINHVKSYKANGYPPAHGTLQAREAVAEAHSVPEAPLTANDVILANGASGALELCVNVLCNKGSNILLPRPGFSLYGSLATTRFVESKFYNLLPESNWEIDLAHMESLIDDKTSAILVNNPSNPCGSVYTREHLEAILAVAAKHHVPVIADEIYSGFVFKGSAFYPMASLTTEVPVLSVGGLAKKWLVPGWRLGWILVHDRNDAFKEIKEGLLNLSQIILGPNSLIQAALRDILHSTPARFYDETIAQVEKNTILSMEALSKIDGLKPVMPQGAMYMMVGIQIDKFKDISSDEEFSQKLLAEESVLCLPGECFNYPNYVRIVTTPPADRLEEAYKRINEFLMKAIALVGLLALSAMAQEGTSVPNAGAQAGSSSSYSCDPGTCQPSNGCFCASKNPPNGLSPTETPQFVTITFDDSVQSELFKTARKLLNVTNPNGCPARGTWFVSMQYTDFSLVQQWFSSGNEVADHTFTHVGQPSDQEIASCRTMLNAYGGIPNGKIQGFRAPFLNYTRDTLAQLSRQGFLYDSSASAVSEDVYWPYTLDHGMANDCWTGICGANQVKLPGLWEIPMYAVLDNGSIPQLMDVYMAGAPEDTTKWSTDAFNKHYNGGRQPFGIYVHPTHLTGYPGLPDPAPKLDALVSFIKTISEKPDVWLVTNQQLLQWMKNPVKASELGNQDYMKCQQPVIAKEICNGLDDDNNGSIDDNLLNSCNFGTTTFKTCFNCPGSAPTLDNPTPATSVQNGSAEYRYALPNNCDTKWWDPVGNACLCTSTECQYKDTAVPVNKTLGPGGVNANGPGGANAAASLILQPVFPTIVLLALTFFLL